MCSKQLHGGLHDPFMLHVLNRLYRSLQKYVQPIQLILIQSARVRLIAHKGVHETLHDTLNSLNFGAWCLHLLVQLDKHDVLRLHAEVIQLISIVQESHHGPYSATY